MNISNLTSRGLKSFPLWYILQVHTKWASKWTLSVFQQEVNCNTHSQLQALSSYQVSQQIWKTLSLEKWQAKNTDTQKKTHLGSLCSSRLPNSCSEFGCSNWSLCWIIAIHVVPIWHLKLDFLSSSFIMMTRDGGT